MQTKVRFVTRNLLSIAAVASFLSAVPLSFAFAADEPGNALDPAEAQAQKAWRETMHALPAPASGCFHASFPNTQWEEVECEAPGSYRSALPASISPLTVGNGRDYVAQAPAGHVFSSVLGEFPAGKDVQSEKGVGVANPFHDGGVLGPNEYTLQLNTDIHNSAACDGYSHCRAWQQYIVSSNYVSLTSKPIGKTAVFIEYWLINYGVHDGRDICPAGFLDSGADGSGPGDDCVQNSPATIVHNGILPITALANLALGATAQHGGTDEAVAFYGKDSYKISVHDSLTDISTVWNQAEFNVVGNAGGSRADFNSGAELLVALLLDYGSSSAPKCEPPSKVLGTTGETNNLTLGACIAEGGKSPYIEFEEGN